MIELIASKVLDGEERHFVLVEETYSEGDEPFTLLVYSSHYSAARREVARAFFWTLAEGQAYCREEYGIEPRAWRPAAARRFREQFAFNYGVTPRGVPQPHPLGFEHAEIAFRLGAVGHPDGPPTPVLDISGNREGLRWLAALLLLCAHGERYDPNFHVHLDRSEHPGLDLDVTLRAPSFLAQLRRGPLRQWRA